MEIKPQELRLSNIVTIDNPVHWPELKGLPFKVTCIELVSDNDFPKSTASIGLIDDQGRTYSQFSEFIKPIELTPEWLERFRFRRQNNAWNGPNKSFDFSIWNPFKTESEFTLNDTVLCPRIYYVHQLQNLYFALTGEELAIDKTSLKN